MMDAVRLRETDPVDNHAYALLVLVQASGGEILWATVVSKMKRWRAESAYTRIKEIRADTGVQLVKRESYPYIIRSVVHYHIEEDDKGWRVSWQSK